MTIRRSEAACVPTDMVIRLKHSTIAEICQSLFRHHWPRRHTVAPQGMGYMRIAGSRYGVEDPLPLQRSSNILLEKPSQGKGLILRTTKYAVL
jgi:hypothetical protein